MKKFLSRLSRPGRSTLAAACASLLILGCSTAPKTPEGVGKEVAQVLCGASNRQDELLYAHNTQIANDIKSGKIKTRAQLQARHAELFAAMKGDDIAATTTRTDSIVARLDADFPRREDRLAVGQVIDRYIKQCDSTFQAKKASRPELHLRELSAQLTGPDPTANPSGDQPPMAPPVLR